MLRFTLKSNIYIVSLDKNMQKYAYQREIK